ncbi:MAG: hypothetical protein U0793_06245 [Gemmataceae bacterium]
MARFFRRHRLLSHVLVGVFGLMAGASVGVYVNVITPSVADVGIPPPVWVVLALVFFGLQVGVLFASLGGNPTRASLHDKARTLLEITTRALVLPHRLGLYPIRAQCRVYNKERKALEPFCQWSYPVCADSTLPIFCAGPDRDVLVIARAFHGNVILAEELPADHHDRYHGAHKGMIWDELRCVLAAPIRDPRDPTRAPIGTISFDSSKRIDAVGFDSDEAKQLAEAVSGVLFPILEEL